jgi:hypothetical protein
MSYGPPSAPPMLAKPFAESRSQDETTVKNASNNFIFVFNLMLNHHY